MNISARHFAEALGIVAVILSLIFVGYELRLARSIAESEGFNEISELTRSMNEFIASNSEVWRKGCMSEELTSSEAIEFQSMIHSLINFEWTRWSRSRIGISNAPSTVGASSLARNIYNFPGFKEAWDTNSQKGSPVFQQAVTDEYEALIDSGNGRNVDVALCGK